MAGHQDGLTGRSRNVTLTLTQSSEGQMLYLNTHVQRSCQGFTDHDKALLVQYETWL